MATLTAKTRNSLPRSSFAFVDSEGKGHLPIHDEGHVRAAMGRFDQTDFPDDSTKAAAKGKILGAAKRLGIDSDTFKGADSSVVHTHSRTGGGSVRHSHSGVTVGHSHSSGANSSAGDDDLLPMEEGADSDSDDQSGGPASMGENVALFAVDTGTAVGMGEGKPIPFLTTGSWTFDEYGAFEVTADDLRVVKRNFDEDVRRQKLPIINEHHDPTRAVGKIKSLEFDGEDRLVAIPDWNPLGEELMQKGAYSYTSPELNYKALILRNWADPEHHEVKHPIVASGLAVTNFPKIKKLGAIAATEASAQCELLAFAESDSVKYMRGPVDVTEALLKAAEDDPIIECADPDGDGDDDGPTPPCIYQPPAGACPGYTRRPGDADGDGTCLMADRGCNGYVARSVGNVESRSVSAVSWSEQSLTKTTSTGANLMSKTTVEEPTAIEPVAPAPADTTAPAPAPVVAASEDLPKLHALLMAEQESRKTAEAKFAAAEERLNAAEEQLRSMARERTVNGVRAEFDELKRAGKVTPAEIKALLADDDNAIKLSENRFVIDALKARPSNSAVHLGEVGTTGDTAPSDPVDQLKAIADKLRSDDPSKSPEVAFSEAVNQHPEIYAEFSNQHYSRARTMSA